MGGTTKDANEELKAGAPPSPADSVPMRDPTEVDAVNLDRNAPSMAQLYGAEQLKRDQDRRLVSLSHLPPWPQRTGEAKVETGHGWGDTVNRTLGGGICPGYMIAIGANHAGAGKTAWTMQIADGLALRTELLANGPKETEGVLTPVMVLSEMSAEALTWRSLARWTGRDARIFRAGQTAAEMFPVHGGQPNYALVEDAFHDARFALSNDSPFGRMRQFMRCVQVNAVGPELLDTASKLTARWVEELKEKYQRPVWPVIVIDPIQRWQRGDANEVEALNELVERLRDCAQRGEWTVLCTSDTNKASATGNAEVKEMDPRERATASLRGSYKLFHLVDAAVFLDRQKDAPPGGSPATETDKAAQTEKERKRRELFGPAIPGPNAPYASRIQLTVVKNRWGSTAPAHAAGVDYKWEVTTHRFEPISEARKESV